MQVSSAAGMRVGEIVFDQQEISPTVEQSPYRLTVGRHQVVEADVPETWVIHIGESEAVRLVGPNTPADVPGRVWRTDLKSRRYLAGQPGRGAIELVTSSSIP